VAIAVCLFIPLLVTWIGASSRPIFNERYVLNGAPAFYLLASAAVLGIEGGIRRSGRSETRAEASVSGALAANALRIIGVVTGAVLLAAALVSLGHYYADPAYSKSRGWRELAATMARLSDGVPSAEVRLVQNFPDPSLWYYYRGSVAHLVLPPAASDAAGADEETAKLAASGIDRVIFAPQQVDWWDDDGIAEAALANHFSLVAATPVRRWVVQAYTRAPDLLSPVDAHFANGVTLAAAATESRQVAPGGLLVVHLKWVGSEDALSGAGKVTLQLLDPQGALAAQVDLPFGASDVKAPVRSYGILLPQELSPGKYRLIAALYDPARADSARVLTANGADHVELGEVGVQ
jgi:hypothetical protein